MKNDTRKTVAVEIYHTPVDEQNNTFIPPDQVSCQNLEYIITDDTNEIEVYHTLIDQQTKITISPDRVSNVSVEYISFENINEEYVIYDNGLANVCPSQSKPVAVQRSISGVYDLAESNEMNCDSSESSISMSQERQHAYLKSRSEIIIKKDLKKICIAVILIIIVAIGIALLSNYTTKDKGTMLQLCTAQCLDFMI